MFTYNLLLSTVNIGIVLKNSLVKTAIVLYRDQEASILTRPSIDPIHMDILMFSL
jgi:hypothetical protein